METVAMHHDQLTLNHKCFQWSFKQFMFCHKDNGKPFHACGEQYQCFYWHHNAN